MKIIATIAFIIIFIGVFFCLGIISNMANRYNECRDHFYSDTPQCNMIDFGRSVVTGMMLLGMLTIVSVGSAYILLKLASGADRKKPSSIFGDR